MTFPSLEALPGYSHRFTLRHPDIDVNEERATVIDRLREWHLEHVTGMGFATGALRTAEQVHGADVAVVQSGAQSSFSNVDGLISDQPGIVLGIFVADCCAVYLVDSRSGAFGIVHSGKKGSALGITPRAIRSMGEHFGSRPADLVVQLSPCIRPPAYEVDFASQIRQQALEAGVPPSQVHDTGVCTSSDLQRFYSYRMEKGRTGRMLALLGRHQTS